MSDYEYEQVLSISKINLSLKGYGTYSKCYPLTGLIKCLHCNRSMHICSTKNKNGITYVYYRCRAAYLSCLCPNRSTTRDTYIEDLVISELKNKAYQISLLVKEEKLQSTSVNPLIAPILNKIKVLESLEDPELTPNIRKLYSQIDHIHNREKSLSTSTHNKRQLLLDCFQDDLFFKSRTKQEKRDIYLLLIELITINSNKEISITLKV